METAGALQFTAWETELGIAFQGLELEQNPSGDKVQGNRDLGGGNSSEGLGGSGAAERGRLQPSVSLGIEEKSCRCLLAAAAL